MFNNELSLSALIDKTDSLTGAFYTTEIKKLTVVILVIFKSFLENVSETKIATHTRHKSTFE